MNNEDSREAVIKEFKRLVEKYSGEKEPPRAIGGPYSLTPQQMLQEVEKDTELGRSIVAAFKSLLQQFPPAS